MRIHTPLRLMAVLAHPDDESLGFGGTLAKYAAGGVETSLITATRGRAGRYRGAEASSPGHPGAAQLGAIREVELRAAASTLGIRDLVVLDHADGQLDRVTPRTIVTEIADHVRRIRPQVVMTFAPDGAYGHPDHIAISQFATAAIVAAAHADSDDGTRRHSVDKLYYLAWPAATWLVYERAFHRLAARVDGVERRATPWPDWAITTTLDARAHSAIVWRAIACHASQVSAYAPLDGLSAADRDLVVSQQSFYRVFSTVNGGRRREHDLFEGLRAAAGLAPDAAPLAGALAS